MSAREDILGSVRKALAGAPAAPTVPRDYRSVSYNGDLVALFAERVSEYRAVVERAPDVADAITGALAGRSAVVPDGLPYDVAGAVRDPGLSAAELDRIDAVVTTAALGIALTGTIVLDHGPGQGRRALSLVPDFHVCVVRTDQIVFGVPDAISRLDPHRPQTWISGPSATSDIELSRVEGVHGPRTLHVLLTERHSE